VNGTPATPVHPRTIEEAAQGLRSGAYTSSQLTMACLDRIAATQDTLGAFVTVCEESARKAAAVADRDLADGIDRGPLMGVPLAVKDVIATQDAPTTANSRALPTGWGNGIDAPATARLRAAGAVIVGKSTTSELALGHPDGDAGFPVPRNPWNLAHSPSGSSSGNGIAIVAGLALGGIGTDTAGSVRGPAAANGHTGLKVTYGRVPKTGVVPLADSLDTVGPMARSARDCAILLDAVSGHDPGDPHATRVELPDTLPELTGSVDQLRIGLPRPYFFDEPRLADEARAAVLAAVGILSQAGALITDTSLDHAREAQDATVVTMLAEAFAQYRPTLVDHWNDYGRHARALLARGALLSGADYLQAQRVRSWFRQEVAQRFRSFDVLITPGCLGPAERTAVIDPERSMLGPSFNGPWSLVGLPAVVLPCGMSASGLPLALQIIGRPFAEGTVLRVADAYQRRTGWHLMEP
jgi:aspartyl-tRNA(Asn)/glutamyl-tRNA(Gln) amidotransferase subunit A